MQQLTRRQVNQIMRRAGYTVTRQVEDGVTMWSYEAILPGGWRAELAVPYREAAAQCGIDIYESRCQGGSAVRLAGMVL